RLAGGVLQIHVGQDPDNDGLVIATIVLLGVGLSPLLAVGITFIRMLCAHGFEDKPKIRLANLFLRVLVLAALICLIAGISVAGNSDDPSIVLVGLELLRVGICLLAVLLATLFILYAYVYHNKDRLTTINVKVLERTAIALPFLFIRIVYSFLSYFDPDPFTSQWSPLYGSVGASVGMALIMEYAAVAVYVGVGLFTIVHEKERHHQRAHGNPSAHGEVIQIDKEHQASGTSQV
ncbi:hypothetical protein MMC11_009098, partial [Xylographa trunciseda]|nr:hypothetical protein [Xylographa trunciseda]